MNGVREADETVLVLGAGMAGLSLALALTGTGKRVVIVERDPPPPDIEPHEAFEGWKRTGVWQFRYPHVFVGRLRVLLAERYPELLAELSAEGFRAAQLADHLPPGLREAYVPHPLDEGIAPLHGRRATFEYVLRRHVGRLPHVRFVHGAVAQGLLSERDAEGALRVVGFECKRDGAREELRGDVVVDAGGRNSPVRGWLEALGARLEFGQEASDLAYFCRHYRLREDQSEPLRRDLSADLDYLKYAIFYAERGHFAIAFGCAEHETDLVELLRRPEGFDGLCRQIPALAEWVERAEATTKVLGAAKIANRKTRIAGAPSVTGLFLLGDSAYEANPIYGRGCAAAFVQSHLLAAALAGERAWGKRVARFETGLRAELEPYHTASVRADRLFHARAERARGARGGLWRWVLIYGYERVIVPAVLVDMVVAREILRVMSMATPPPPLRIVRFVVRAVRTWLLQAGATSVRALPKPPERAALLERAAQGGEAESGQ